MLDRLVGVGIDNTKYEVGVEKGEAHWVEFACLHCCRWLGVLSVGLFCFDFNWRFRHGEAVLLVDFGEKGLVVRVL